ncbi:MAG TPA: nucleotidyltransferase domain-containing protein [Solirubrobacteraceae bacterium]|nr:nucleotidyltransferase domain-containing protein [Solirubrobacteraceae bacterium]
MTTLAQASLSTEERVLLTRFSAELYAEEVEPQAIWLFGSRARGEQPAEDSDVDVLVLVEDASWAGKMRVHAALQSAARELDLQGLTWSFSVHINTPAWLTQRREIRSFFIAEVDRDKIVLAGRL